MNGKIAFSSNRTGNADVYVMNPDGSSQTSLTTNPADDCCPAWSADGRRIVFVSTRDGNPQIYVMNADGTAQTRLTNNSVNDSFPSWSPDGTRIAFIRSLGPRSGDVYVMNADGTGQMNLTNNTPGDFPADFSTAWSPDGTKIAFSRSLSDTNQEIYSMNADGSGRQALTSNGVISRLPNWSPDGTKIAFDRGPAGSADIYVMNADGSGQTNLTNNGGQIDQEAAWSPDGTKIVFVSVRAGNYEIFVMNADGTGQTHLTVPGHRDGRPDWGPLSIVPGTARVTLTPAAAENPVGTNHTVTATVTDTLGQPMPSVTVQFMVEGSVSAAGSCTTNVNGQCDVTYPGPQLPGADLITAYPDLNDNNMEDANELAGTATKAWLLLTSTPGLVTGGGHILASDSIHEIAFGFNARSTVNGFSGHCTVIDPSRQPETMIECVDVTALVQTPNPGGGGTATFFGNATVNGMPTTYRIDVADVAEPGAGRDTFSIQTDNGYMAGGPLTRGNIQVHR